MTLTLITRPAAWSTKTLKEQAHFLRARKLNHQRTPNRFTFSSADADLLARIEAELSKRPS
ncbi:hypothetical protein ACW9KT_15505 [Hymenobacter sp. HD11105]